jgi:hypothetical protein
MGQLRVHLIPVVGARLAQPRLTLQHYKIITSLLNNEYKSKQRRGGLFAMGRTELSVASAGLPGIDSQHRDSSAGAISARLDRLPATATIWWMVCMLSFGGFFEFYELFSTASVVPGMVRSGILKQTTTAFFALDGIAGYVAATFAGLFIGTFVFGFIADKLGRRTVFTYALLWYSASAVAMAFQADATGLNFWRLMTGIGLGVELVTIDAYLSELMPSRVRGRAFALNQVITYSAVPMVSFLAWQLVPLAPLRPRWLALGHPDRRDGRARRVGDPAGSAREPALARQPRRGRARGTHRRRH